MVDVYNNLSRILKMDFRIFDSVSDIGSCIDQQLYPSEDILEEIYY